jgi:putative addiction module killer protein
MLTVVQSDVFAGWLAGLKDLRGRARIVARIELVRIHGHFGDAKSVGEGVSEMRINYGPGFRLYFTLRGAELVILLCGGDKGSQTRDIRAAIRLSKELQ